VSSNGQAALVRPPESAIHTAACRRQVKPNATGTKKATKQVVGVSSVWVSLTRQRGGVAAAGQHSVLTEGTPEARAWPWQGDGVQAASPHPRRSYPFRAVVAPSADSLMPCSK